MKNPVLLAQSVLAALQLANLGPALEGVGLPVRYVVLLAALVGCAQFALAMYQHGADKGSSEAVAPSTPAPATPDQGATPSA